MDEDGKETAEELHFFYDAQSRPAFVEYEGEMYRYIHNLQGDVVAIVDDGGNIVVEYKYDAWGKTIYEAGGLLSSLGDLNPFRYRGYVWDAEINLYYLRSRYYNSIFGRFVSSDSSDVIDEECKSILDSNLFAYCSNNPIIREDQMGYAWLTFFVKAAVGAVINTVTSYIAAKATNQSFTIKDAVIAAGAGVANALNPIIGGIFSAVTSYITARQNEVAIGGALICAAVSGLATMYGISNIADMQVKDGLSIATTAFTDLVFGTGENCIATGTNKMFAENANKQSNDCNNRGNNVTKQSWHNEYALKRKYELMYKLYGI